MIQFLSEQPIILWSIAASLILFLAAGGIGFGQSYLKKRRRREKLIQKSAALAQAAEASARESANLEPAVDISELPTDLPAPAGETETKGGQDGSLEKSSEFQINSVEAGSDPDESFEVEEDSMLAAIFSEEVVVDPKFMALVSRQNEIQIDDLAHTTEDILAIIQSGRSPEGIDR